MTWLKYLGIILIIVFLMVFGFFLPSLVLMTVTDVSLI